MSTQSISMPGIAAVIDRDGGTITIMTGKPAEEIRERMRQERETAITADVCNEILAATEKACGMIELDGVPAANAFVETVQSASQCVDEVKAC